MTAAVNQTKSRGAVSSLPPVIWHHVDIWWRDMHIPVSFRTIHISPPREHSQVTYQF